MKTRDRIRYEARLLFNEQGFGNTTTAALAAHLGIAEGNLWYHFKNKRALLDAISGEFITVVEQRLAQRPQTEGRILEDYVRLIDIYLTELRDYRFLYRDQADYGDLGEEVLRRLPQWYTDTREQFRFYFNRMMDAGLLEMPPERMDDLVTNVTIIIRYSLEYQRETQQPATSGSGAVRQAIARHLTLFQHYLTDEAAAVLQAAIRQGGAIQGAIQQEGERPAVAAA